MSSDGALANEKMFSPLFTSTQERHFYLVSMEAGADISVAGTIVYKSRLVNRSVTFGDNAPQRAWTLALVRVSHLESYTSDKTMLWCKHTSFVLSG